MARKKKQKREKNGSEGKEKALAPQRQISPATALPAVAVSAPADPPSDNRPAEEASQKPDGEEPAAEVLSSRLRGLVSRWLRGPATRRSPQPLVLGGSEHAQPPKADPPAEQRRQPAETVLERSPAAAPVERPAVAPAAAELEEARRALHQLREASQERIQQLQEECQQLRAEIERERLQRSAAEQRLQEAREYAAKEAAEYEARLRAQAEQAEDSASQGANLRQQLEQSREQIRRLEELLERSRAELEAAQGRLRKEREAALGRIQKLELDLQAARDQNADLESRLKAAASAARESAERPGQKPDSTRGKPEPAEGELGAAPSSLAEEALTTAGRLSRRESRWGDLKSRLLPKDREISELRRQAEQFRERIQELEQELGEARQQTASQQAAPAAEPPAGGPEPPLLTRQAMEALYNQSMNRLTVLMASADIVLLNPKLDPKVKATVQDIKTEGQALLALIKSYTLPSEAPKSS